MKENQSKTKMWNEVSTGYIKNAGITLIALVVTIVVLLILAGITIQIVMNGRNNGKCIKSRFANKNISSRR